MDPMVGSVAATNGGMISDCSDNADLLDFCFLCSRQFFHESLDNYGTERLKDEEILETFFEELGPVDRSLLQCCPACQALCKTLIRTREALSSLIDEITCLLLQSRKVSYLLSKSRVVSRLFQSSNSSLPPCETSTSYLQQPLSQINFPKDVSNHGNNNSNCFPTRFDLRLDSSNLSVGDPLDLGLSNSATNSISKKSPTSKSKNLNGKCSSETQNNFKSNPVSFNFIVNDSIMNSVSDNACDIISEVGFQNNSKVDASRTNSNYSHSPEKEYICSSTNIHRKVKKVSLKALEDVQELKSSSTNLCNGKATESKNMKGRDVSVIAYAKASTTVLPQPCWQAGEYDEDTDAKDEAMLLSNLKSVESNKADTQQYNESQNEAFSASPTHFTEALVSNNSGYHNEEIEQSDSTKPSKVHCDICHKQFQTLRNLKNHLSAHNKERKFICEICGLSYRNKLGLEGHVAIHTGESRFQCNFCAKSFTQKSGLQRHLRIHTGKHQFQCDKCGKQFLHHTSFNAHKLKHEGIKNFACTICDLTFTQKSHLQRHSKVHLGVRPYVCDLCQRSFTEKYNLQAHLKSHEGTTDTHKCPRCSKSFTRKFKLKQHMNQVHNVSW